MDKITLRLLCEKAGVSRRAVQGYEKAGLICPSGRNKMGHLLYDEKALETVKRIRFYQRLGFSIKEIGSLLEKDSHELKETLILRIGMLVERKEEIEMLIEETRRMIEKL